MSREDGAAVFAAIERHLPHIAYEAAANVRSRGSWFWRFVRGFGA